MASYSRDQAVRRTAGRQRTLVTTEQLTECGLQKDAVAHRVKGGWLHLVFHGVYTVGCGELPPLAREQAALLACGKDTFLSHRSAAFVWGLRKAAPTDVEVSVVGRGCRSRKGLRVHRIHSIHPGELQREKGLWLSSAARVVLEIAAIGSRDELADVVDNGLALRRFTPRDLGVVLARSRPCRGAGRLAELLGDQSAVAITRSRAEKALLRLIRKGGLPQPETNVRFGRFEADFVWQRERLVVELDGYTYHRGPGVFERDHEKDLVYRAAGFDVLRFTRVQVITDPARVLVILAQALACPKSA